MPADEDDRKTDPRFRELLLKCEPAHARQPDIEHEAAGRLRPLGEHEFLRRGKEMHVQAYRPKQSVQ